MMMMMMMMMMDRLKRASPEDGKSLPYAEKSFGFQMYVKNLVEAALKHWSHVQGSTVSFLLMMTPEEPATPKAPTLNRN